MENLYELQFNRSEDFVEESVMPYSKELYGLNSSSINFHPNISSLDPRIHFKWDDPTNEYFLDYLRNDLSWPLMSEKMKDIFEKYCKNDVRFFPIDIINEVNHKKVTFYLLNIIKSFHSDDVIDLSHSKYTYSNNKLIIFVYCFFRNKLENANIFKLEGDNTTKIFISDKLKEALEKEEVTGCEFWNIRLSD